MTTITEPGILIRINQKYRKGMSDEELFEATRGVWKINENGLEAKKAKYAFAIYKGEIKEVYKIKEWHKAGTTSYKTRQDVHDPRRREFAGGLAEDEIRNKYLSKSVKEYSPGTRNFSINKASA